LRFYRDDNAASALSLRFKGDSTIAANTQADLLSANGELLSAATLTRRML
jgi:hypothetical protein